MRHFTSLIFLIAVLAAAGCGGERYSVQASFRPPSGVHSVASSEMTGKRLHRIAVLPFRNESGVPKAGEHMADIFYQGLASSRRYEVQPPPKITGEEGFEFEIRLRGSREEGVRNREAEEEWLKKTVERFASTVQPYLTDIEPIYPGEYFEGQVEAPAKIEGTMAKSDPARQEEPEIDAVVTGVVTRFRNRSGNAILGEQGPHVIYRVFLIGAQDGKILWEGTFDEEQIYLLDNLLLLPRYAEAGLLWQTNESLARNGLRRLLAQFPGLRPEEEKSKEGSSVP